MSALEVAVVNRSITVVDGWDETAFENSVDAFNLVANGRFLDSWGPVANFSKIEAHYISKSQPEPDGTPYQVRLVDKVAVAGDLGYHLLHDSIPQALVSLGADELTRCDPCVTWTHEAFEMAVDRKSTRLNSSHPSISYAVFCLKKKKEK